MLESAALRRILLAVAALAGVGAILFAVLSSDTDDEDVLITSNVAVEELIPRRNAEVLSQQMVGVDLAPGFSADLILNGTPIPSSEVRYVPGLNRFTFSPGRDKIVERLRAEQNCVQARYWRTAEGPAQSQSITWCFTAF